MKELTPELINKEIVPAIKELFQTRKYLNGSSIIQVFIKKLNLPHDIAEEALRLLIGEKVLLNVKQPKDLYSDYFKLNYEIIDSYIYTPSPEEEQESEIIKSGIKSLSTYKEEVYPVFELPPHIIRQLNVDFIRQKELFRNLISGAKKEIKITSPFMDETGLANYIYELIEKCKNGVKIKILTRNDESRKRVINLLKSTLSKINPDLVEIRSYHETDEFGVTESIHSKMIIVDDIEVYIGSGEIRKNSIFGVLCEAGIYIKGPIAKIYSKFFDVIWGESHPV